MPDNGKILYLDPIDAPPQHSSDGPEDAGELTDNAANTLADLILIIQECGQDPVTQLAGYLMTDDPTYLPEHGHARLLAARIGRDKLLEVLIRFYLKESSHPAASPSPVL